MRSLEFRDHKFERSNVALSHEERSKMFYWCRDQAYDTLLMAKQSGGLATCEQCSDTISKKP